MFFIRVVLFKNVVFIYFFLSFREVFRRYLIKSFFFKKVFYINLDFDFIFKDIYKKYKMINIIFFFERENFKGKDY